MSDAEQAAASAEKVEERAPVDRLREEAEKLAFGEDAEIGDMGGILHGRNGSVRVEVLPPLDWDFNANELLAAGEYPAFMRAITDEENYAKVCDVRPSHFQILQFITGADGGEDLGESPAS